MGKPLNGSEIRSNVVDLAAYRAERLARKALAAVAHNDALTAQAA